MTIEPRFQIIDKIAFGDKQFQVSLFTRPGFSPQVRIKTFQIIDEEPDPRLVSVAKFRLHTALKIADAIYEADDLYQGGHDDTRVSK